MNRIAAASAASLIMTSPPTSACACCADDGDFYSAPAPQLESVLPNVQFGAGNVRDVGYEVGWAVSGITRSGDSFMIHTEIGDFAFKLSAPPTHRSADITFITQPNGNKNHMNDVYHEVEFNGSMALPPEAAEYFGAASNDATLLLQGNGNSCFHESSLQRWLLRVEFDRNILWGIGKLVTQGS